jgi:hypothetical protein
MNEENINMKEYQEYLVYHPKWKFFKPPKWKCFMWAYNIETRYAKILMPSEQISDLYNTHLTQDNIANSYNCKERLSYITVKDLIDTLISHNDIIALWGENDPWGEDEDKNHSYLLWKGMGWNIPNNLSNLEVIRIVGTIPESITEADTINILIKN